MPVNLVETRAVPAAEGLAAASGNTPPERGLSSLPRLQPASASAAAAAVQLPLTRPGYPPNVRGMPATPKAEWKRPTKRRVRTILARLRETYGRPVERAHRAPVGELILTALSQNTNDRNRDVAYARLTARCDSWDAVRDAPVEEVEDAIRPGGLAPTKAVRIQEILRALGDDDISDLADIPLNEARAQLCELPGVGRKTAACVLMFSFG